MVGTQWHGWLLMSPLRYFSWCSLTPPPPPLPPLSFSQKHMFSSGWWRYVRKALQEPLEISSHISLLPSYNSIKLRTGNPAVKKSEFISSRNGVSKFKIRSSQPRLALLNFPPQIWILGAHLADTASVRSGKRQQVGLKCQESDLHNKLLGAGFHFCTFLELQCHQWHRKRGATAVTTSERGQDVTWVLERASCAHWRNGTLRLSTEELAAGDHPFPLLNYPHPVL